MICTKPPIVRIPRQALPNFQEALDTLVGRPIRVPSRCQEPERIYLHFQHRGQVIVAYFPAAKGEWFLFRQYGIGYYMRVPDIECGGMAFQVVCKEEEWCCIGPMKTRLRKSKPGVETRKEGSPKVRALS